MAAGEGAGRPTGTYWALLAVTSALRTGAGLFVVTAAVVAAAVAKSFSAAAILLLWDAIWEARLYFLPKSQ